MGEMRTNSSSIIFNFRRSSGIGKLIWITALVLAWSYCAFQSVSQVHQYLKYRTTVSVQIKSATDVPFPGITVCNLNPFKLNKVTENLKAKELAYIVSTESSDTVDDYIEEERTVTDVFVAPTMPSNPIDNNYTDAFMRDAVKLLKQQATETVKEAADDMTHKFQSVKNTLESNLETIKLDTRTSISNKSDAFLGEIDSITAGLGDQIAELRRKMGYDDGRPDGTCGCDSGDVSKMAAIIKSMLDGSATTLSPEPRKRRKRQINNGSRYDKETNAEFRRKLDVRERRRKKRQAGESSETGKSNTRPDMNPADRGKAKIIYYAYNNTMDLSKIGHDIENMLLECSFQGMICTAKNFSSWDDGSFGRCHTMFPDRNHPSFSGPSFGLSLVLNAETYEYVPLISPSAGFQVQIHPVDYVPFPADNGFVVSPGQATLIGLKWKTIHRLPWPYDDTDCGELEDVTSKQNMFQSWNSRAQSHGMNGMNYTAQVCEKSCYLAEILDKCKCNDAAVLPYSEAQRYYGDKLPSACDTTQVDDWKCMKNVTAGIVEERRCVKECPQPCFETEYVTTITSSAWPRVGGRVWQTYQQRPDLFPLDQNIVKLHVFFQELNYELVVERPSMNVFDLMSDIGGTFGLFIGISFLTLLEFIQVTARVVKGTKQSNVSSGS